MTELDETGRPVISGLFLLWSEISEMKIPKILKTFEHHNHISHKREFKETKSVTGGEIHWEGTVRRAMRVAGQKQRKSKHQIPVSAGFSSKAVDPLPITVPKEEDILDIVVPAAHVELSEKARTAFATLSDTIKAIYSV